MPILVQWKWKELEHGLIWRGFQPDYEYFGPLTYTIDVVKKEYFTRFLSQIEQDIQLLAQQIRYNLDAVCNYMRKGKSGTFGQ